MKIDKHSDSIQELHDYLMDELHGITTSLNGKLTTYTISNSSGDNYKRIQIDYDFHSKSPLDIHPSDTKAS